MLIGDRLRAFREEKNLSQRDIEKRTGLLCCYVSRVENGYMVPAIENLEKLARALEIPIYELFYDGEEPPEEITPPSRRKMKARWGDSGRDSRMLLKLRRLLSKTDPRNQQLLLSMAQKMAKKVA